jgi:undecaprenyl-diphosphatase
VIRRLAPAARSGFAAVDRARLRLDLTGRAAALVGTGAAGVAMAALVLVSVGEDVVQRNGLADSDPAHLHLFTAHRPAALVEVARVVTGLGNVLVLAALAVVAGIVLWRCGAGLVVAVAPGLALGAAAAIDGLGKSIVGRARPPASLRLVAESDASFPSGHAANSTALFVAVGILVAAIILRRPAARVLAVVASGVVAGLVGLSRLVLGVHWPTDVLAGWAVGVVVAVTIATTALLLARAWPGPGLTRRRLQHA